MLSSIILLSLDSCKYLYPYTQICTPEQDKSIQYTFEDILKTKVLICTWLLLMKNRNYLPLKSYTRETIKQPHLYIKLSKGRSFVSILFPPNSFIAYVWTSFPRSSDMWQCPVKGYSLLDKMTSRNLSTSSVEYVNVL